MENLKKNITSKLHEANFMVKPEDVDQVIDKLGKDDVVKLVDEVKDKNNPWVICTASVGRDNKDKYERCVKDVKKQHGLSEELTEADYNAQTTQTDTRDMGQLQADVQRFMDKLNLGQFLAILDKIDKPVEQAEIIAAFAERIGVPRTKLSAILANLKQSSNAEAPQPVTGESVNPRMTKNELVETVLKVSRPVIKKVKKKDIDG